MFSYPQIKKKLRGAEKNSEREKAIYSVASSVFLSP
jgi:hypothetical protein